MKHVPVFLRVLAVVLLLLTVLAGCRILFGAEGDGTLILVIAPESGEETLSVSGARTLEPGLDMTISDYVVHGTGPNNDSLRVEVDAATTEPIEQSGLTPGDWTIEVTARNAASEAIGYGSAIATVLSGQVVSASVTVSPHSGSGTLALTVTWPAGTVASPQLLGTVTNNSTGDETGLSWTIDDTGDPVIATASLSGLSVGYHRLAIQLLEGGSVDPVWASTTSARILNGQTTTGVFALAYSELNGGSLALTVSPDMQNPFPVTINGARPVLAVGQDLSLSATPTGTGYAHEWYLSGNALAGETSPTLVYGNGLSTGNYRIDLLVEDTPVLSSTGFSFSVISLGDNWMFFGDSETDGRATNEPSALSQVIAFESVYDTSFPSSVYTSLIDGVGGCSLADSMNRYSATAGRETATWVHFQESGNQDLDGQRTPEEFAVTFEQFVRTIHAESPNAVISTETAYSFPVQNPDRYWEPYNTAMKSVVDTLASEGIVVHVAEVDRNIKELVLRTSYDDVVVNDPYGHYKGLGNLMVALSMYDALGFDVNTLDLSGIPDSEVSATHKQIAIDIINDLSS